jgi:hypothetical protein
MDAHAAFLDIPDVSAVWAGSGADALRGNTSLFRTGYDPLISAASQMAGCLRTLKDLHDHFQAEVFGGLAVPGMAGLLATFGYVGASELAGGVAAPGMASALGAAGVVGAEFAALLAGAVGAVAVGAVGAAAAVPFLQHEVEAASKASKDAYDQVYQARHILDAGLTHDKAGRRVWTGTGNIAGSGGGAADSWQGARATATEIASRTTGLTNLGKSLRDAGKPLLDVAQVVSGLRIEASEVGGGGTQVVILYNEAQDWFENGSRTGGQHLHGGDRRHPEGLGDAVIRIAAEREHDDIAAAARVRGGR